MAKSSVESAPVAVSRLAPLTIQPYLSSAKFYLGCGTSTVDPKARKYLAIHDLPNGDIHLSAGPQGLGREA